MKLTSRIGLERKSAERECVCLICSRNRIVSEKADKNGCEQENVCLTRSKNRMSSEKADKHSALLPERSAISIPCFSILFNHYY